MEIPSVWTRTRRQRDQPALTRQQIVAEAVALLDAEGVDALTMRKLGARLDAGATSLYRHVANRDELVELVVDEVYGEIEVPEISDPAAWRAAATTCAHSVRSMILRHPWTATLLGQVGLAYLGPNVMRLSDRMLSLFQAAGFPPDEANHAISTVMAYVIGVGISEAAWLSTLARSGRTEQDLVTDLRPAIEQAAAEYPHMRQQLTSYAEADPAHARDETFTYGLDRVLDGLAAALP
ncbi:TetR/AcrR family transcriptional regulator [Saccharothrix variisporea]|uniref:TetR family transcriptional regulator n=1 Tax=Saccharothrix variisporea TaxID=543527 RepID=A0A495XIQ0_9PSEU|nr:TetR/AcrR family transcriptional regulator [Saccharothrix variisporea]RKT72644.1 TetR family transcriptional regulator [Saccharothrix variisporea]